LPKKNGILHTIYLSENDITDEAAEWLSEIIANTSIVHLNLYKNSITDVGAAVLARGLIQSSHLQYLGLSGNLIGDDGAKAIAEALKSNTTLQKLYLHHNSISDEGAMALATVLSTRTLRVLNLSGNHISSRTVTKIKNKCNNRIGLLDIDQQVELSKSGRRGAKSRGTNDNISSIDRKSRQTSKDNEDKENLTSIGTNEVNNVEENTSDSQSDSDCTPSSPISQNLDLLSPLLVSEMLLDHIPSSQELTLHLINAQQTMIELKEQLQKKSKKLVELNEELDHHKKNRLGEESKVAVQVEFLKQKLARAEKKKPRF